MLQLTIWSGLKELDIGASLQHYNPVIDDMVKKMFDVPESWILNAQMPFGGNAAEFADKDYMDDAQRFRVFG